MRGIARALSGIQEEGDEKAQQVEGSPKLTNHFCSLTMECNKKRTTEDFRAKLIPDD